MADWNEHENSNSSSSFCDDRSQTQKETTPRKRGSEQYLTGKIGGIKEFRVKEKLSLSPLDLSDPTEGIAMHAKRQLLKYNEVLQGVVLSFDELKVDGDPRVLDSGYVLINLSVKYYAFSPQPGDRLRGTVTKVWEGRVACLVYGCFNASVELEEGATVPDVGEGVDFVVRNVNRTKDGILAVEGLMDANKKRRKHKQKKDVS